MKLQHIYTLGDYYKDNLHNICHCAKNGQFIEILSKLTAELLFDKIPNNAILVPLPDRGGFNMALLNNLINKRHDLFYAVGFCNEHRLSWYYRKQNQLCEILPENVGLAWYDCPHRLFDFCDSSIVLLDNVVATGCTTKAAMNIIGKSCDALCIAVDWDKYNKYNKDNE